MVRINEMEELQMDNMESRAFVIKSESNPRILRNLPCLWRFHLWNGSCHGRWRILRRNQTQHQWRRRKFPGAWRGRWLLWAVSGSVRKYMIFCEECKYWWVWKAAWTVPDEPAKGLPCRRRHRQKLRSVSLLEAFHTVPAWLFRAVVEELAS